ncbi:CAP domain-containing protein [Nocardioides sp.]|uniref:CAP domain-containing protein n=1 Tax=Nocardioides sp. TaxID=35761 RepID=UPI00261FE4AC|nr:CAP domain-containing protein [Nocardioides sp.]
MRLVSVSLLLAFTALLAPAPGAAARTAADFESAVHAATNTVRVDHDLGKLRKKGCIDRFANRQAKKMATEGEMFHQDLGPITDKCGLTMVGENVAYGFTKAGTLIKAWMDSPGHRANILTPGYRQLGVGARKSDEGVWYVAQVFGRK